MDMYSFPRFTYPHSSVLKGCSSENIIMVILWQIVQEISHLLLSFEGSHFGSYCNWLCLIYVNPSITFSKTLITKHTLKLAECNQRIMEWSCRTEWNHRIDQC